MDILLVVITIVIVMGIAYILSRPFANPLPAAEMPGETRNYQRQYEDLLREIKTLQDECDHFEAPEEICQEVDEKKQLAVNILRKINAPLEDEMSLSTVNESGDPEETRPESHFLGGSTYVCPQCGSRVASSDKFCTQCGNRLQP